MNICYSCDDAYIHHTGISIISLLENNKDFDEINIYLIDAGISADNIVLIEEIVKCFNRKLVVIPFRSICKRLNISNTGRHIKTVYAKLFFGNIAGLDKILYLDSDVVINGSLTELWDINLGNNFFGCVKTTTKDYCKALGLPKTADFFNDGVALVNSKLLREEQMEDKFITFINKYDGNPPVLSEGTLNVICKGRIYPIHPKFNCLSVFFMLNNRQIKQVAFQADFYQDIYLDEAREHPIIVHYLAATYNRPWDKNCSHPLKQLYLDYKDKSPWNKLPLTDRKQSFKIRFLGFLFKYVNTNLILKIREVSQRF